MGATIRVILPNQRWIFLPGFNIRQFVMAVAAPVGPLKDGDSALRADAGPGQDKELRSRAQRGTSNVFAVLTDHDFTNPFDPPDSCTHKLYQRTRVPSLRPELAEKAVKPPSILHANASVNATDLTETAFRTADAW